MPTAPRRHTLCAMPKAPEAIDSSTSEIRPRFLHRIAWTRGAFDPSNPTVPEHLKPTAGGVARVAVFVDSGLAEANPTLDQEIARALETWSGTELVGGPWLVPGGERAKSDQGVLRRVIEQMREAALCRRSYAMVIGGGAVIDAVGFAAATFHRGVRLVRVPTTTLSQADSAVGVKNGINHAGVKNLLGAFAVPHAVINDADLLDTLTERDWRCGFSEAVKVAVVKDGRFFGALERDAERITARDPEAAQNAIRQSADLHAAHIAEAGDPFEHGEGRPLDFGHWAAHKLESLTHGRVRHGEAVAIGIVLDTRYAALTGLLSDRDADRIRATLLSLRFELWHEAMAEPALLDGLDEFAEHLGGELSIALPTAIGAAREVGDIDRNTMQRAITDLREAVQ